MPADFEACRRQGGKIRTVSGPSEEHGLEADEYVRLCINNGQVQARGEVKTKKEKRDGGE